MIPEKGKKFVETVLTRTKDAKLKWKPTSDEACFSADFPDYTLEAQEFTDSDEHENFMSYLLQIRNSEGRIIDTIRPRDFNGTWNFNGYEKLQTIFEWARSSALGIDAAYDEIMNMLEDEPGENDGDALDEIPF